MNRQLFAVFKALELADLTIFRQLVIGRSIDLAIWSVLSLFVIGYIMPSFGLSNDFGLFQVGGIIATIGLFEIYPFIINLVLDFEGDRAIDYNLTLPASSLIVVIQKMVHFFITAVILTFILIPICKLSMWNKFDLMQVNYLKLVLAIIFANAFYASFVILVASIVPNMSRIGAVWMRLIFPMWFMGGYLHSWSSLKEVAPAIAYIDLFNPIIYVTESIRGAIIGPENFIHFWFCLAAMALATLICSIVGFYRLKKRLDFV